MRSAPASPPRLPLPSVVLVMKNVIGCCGPCCWPWAKTAAEPSKVIPIAERIILAFMIRASSCGVDYKVVRSDLIGQPAPLKTHVLWIYHSMAAGRSPIAAQLSFENARRPGASAPGLLLKRCSRDQLMAKQ